jgi:hypothetical protein
MIGFKYLQDIVLEWYGLIEIYVEAACTLKMVVMLLHCAISRTGGK